MTTTESTVTPAQLGLLHHTLGVRPDRRKPFRNYFVAGPGHHAQANLEALEAAGLMFRQRTPAFCDKDDVVFACTDAGRALALDLLPPEPKRTKYDEFLRTDCSESFAEFLGIRKPKIDVRGGVSFGGWSRFEYRMFRPTRWNLEEISGEWSPTKKDAKASYKAALKASKGEK